MPATHGLHASVARHKARLTSELTKSRIRRGCSSLEALRTLVNNAGSQAAHPRWIRINTLRTTIESQLETTLDGYKWTDNLSNLNSPGPNDKFVYLDKHIPDLIAVSANTDLAKTQGYKDGMLIMQDKASCFPAYLLDPAQAGGDVIDACAAPGNKTTHLAALVSSATSNLQDGPTSKIFACERDTARSQTLAKMVKLAGADKLVSIRASQDFLRLKPDSKEFANVTSLLLDPSCSGSGIVGRDEATISVHLPSATKIVETAQRGKKRKRSANPPANVKVDSKPAHKPEDLDAEEASPEVLEDDGEKLQARLTALSGFQLLLLERAMAFPAARRITYSTCSVHDEENENVVVKALLSDVATERGWRVLRREEQVGGLQKWERRGKVEAVEIAVNANGDSGAGLKSEEVAEACIRCVKSGEEGTMGFFVAGFVRDDGSLHTAAIPKGSTANGNGLGGTIVDEDEQEEEWSGFGDD